jgi:hypothetical protein
VAGPAARATIILGVAVLVDALLVRLMIGAILLRFIGARLGPSEVGAEGARTSVRIVRPWMRSS